jgi:chromosome segregation protein
MRLKKIKLAGFKSFVDPTTIPFPDDMTAIVGPNGCGKSNVIDAVRWVLGESSAKNLRGDAMTDVIFNGSTARKPVSQCSVELVFDNSSGRIQGEYSSYNELSVKRLVTREAQSHYFLNASKCRRRDVTDLFLGTGLGPRSYAIIEQGMISRLIESKPQELRVFIEEAAGISKYKERRRETENRIRHTKENLERLEDVRGELGQQLEKLQRQANAARRYKELKAKERTFKAELAALRWIKHSDQIASLENTLYQQETEVEGFIAQQRGDESNITAYRERQLSLKQTLADVQQQFFTLGNDITRLEQNQLHAKRRRQQIEQEQNDLTENINEFEAQIAAQNETLEKLTTQLEVAEPESALLEDELEQAQFNLTDAEQKLSEHEHLWREQEHEFSNLKQQVQSKHSQIQATMNMQLRTQQRLSELQQEQGELEHDFLAEQMESLSREVAQAKGHFRHVTQQFEQQTAENQRHDQTLRELELQQLRAQGEVQQVEAKISALESMQSVQSGSLNLDAYLSEKGFESEPLWQYLRVEKGWEKALETVCHIWQKAQVILNDNNAEITQFSQFEANHLLFGDSMTENKPANTLASKLLNEKVPQWLSQVLIVEELQDAQDKRANLKVGQTCVTRAGHWVARDWLVTGYNDDDSGMLERAAQLRDLNIELAELKLQLDDFDRRLENTKQSASVHADKLGSTTADYKQAEQALTQLQNQLNLLEMQHQQSLMRQSKLSEELSRQQQLLEDERLQSEELAEQVEILEMTLADKQQQQVEMQDGKLQRSKLVEDCRRKAEELKNRSHQFALSLQSVNSQYQNLIAGQSREKQQLAAMNKKQLDLQEELSVLSLPMTEQAEQLEQLLEVRVETELKQNQISEQLTEVEALLNEAEKGQQGIVSRIESMRMTIQSTKLECEGFRVRAKGVVEQLQEMQQPLKPLLESLPEHANEKEWQTELEKTSASISRLGAVNLAAVEEFDLQSERKKHLDDQNDDLCAAMETLEGAIRKIDKETKSRFRDTFDRVNEDLKQLFPKVFGGGSAYLDLTDDDLLETGVTIMARPPGKKNSTIHLLSGGEKALTALSLVFAIFRLNPAPFCLLDEVDAPLDDANVGRFCKLVSEMSKTVQFIYITHNKIAMEMAKHLTGVTMAEPGVSRMVAVDVEEAVAFVQT